jgi:hypothetical protein
MGGYNSGRYGGRPTIEATGSYILSTSWLRRLTMKTGMHARAQCAFSDGFSLGVTFDLRDSNRPFLELSHEPYNDGAGSVRYVVPLLRTRPPFGGVRWWFACPRTGRRVTKLYLPRGGSQFWSRKAYGLGYACQREDTTSRRMRRARKLHRALGGDGEALGQEPPPKPKGMRWRTYERKLAAWEAAEANADASWAAGAFRLLARL